MAIGFVGVQAGSLVSFFFVLESLVGDTYPIRLLYTFKVAVQLPEMRLDCLDNGTWLWDMLHGSD